MTRFFVPGTPAPQGSKRYVGHRANRYGPDPTKRLPVLVESSAKVAPWRSVVAQVAALKCRGIDDGPVSVEVDFVLHRPKSLPRRIRHMIKKPDLDKLVRSTLDALSGVAYPDDNRVVRIVATKRYHLDPLEQTGATIRVEPATDVLELMHEPRTDDPMDVAFLAEDGWLPVGSVGEQAVYARRWGGNAA